MNDSEPDQNQSMEKKCPQCGAILPAGALEGLCPACLLKQGATPETGSQPQAAPFQPPSVEEVARLFPQLEIQAFLGKGGMGAVYKARQPAIDRIVAIKILPSQTAGDPGFADRFNREARALARLSHPNIVAFHEFGQVNGQPFFIMEFVDGLNLRQLEQAGRLTPSEALKVVPQICEALQFAHDEGVVHRDIKPENILVDKKGRVKIADFGIAKMMGREPEVPITETRTVVGTPHYMAPEQVEKPQTVDHRADIYSLGVVFYEMLTGELPIGKFAPPSRKVTVDVRLDEVVLRALEKEPEQRYQAASQVKTAVDTIASTAPPPRPDAQAIAREILARDYFLNIGGCLRRSVALLKTGLWPTAGITVLILLLVQAAYSSAIGVVVAGPLMGGLWLYYMKRIRGQTANVDTAFSGFSIDFLNLFLVGLVGMVLTILGFICLVLPGIYLLISWIFAGGLIIDKRLEFWDAMELSRKTVGKHWWKCFGFWLVMTLINFAGLLMFGLGFFITAPITVGATIYAYEDIFGSGSGAAGVDPSGTSVSPVTPLRTSGPGGIWKPLGIALAMLMLIVAFAGTGYFLLRARGNHRRARHEMQTAERVAQTLAPSRNYAFGPLMERILNDPDNDSHNSCLDLVSSELKDLPVPWPTFPYADETLSNTWNSMILPASQRNIDLACGPDGHSVRVFLRAIAPVPDELFDQTSIENGPKLAELMRQMVIDRGTPANATITVTDSLSSFVFETRDEKHGILQVRTSNTPTRGVQVRYRLVDETPGSPDSVSVEARQSSHQTLADRLDAASTMNSLHEKDRSLAAIATDAGRAGDTDVVKRSVQQINDYSSRDKAASESARLLSNRGLRKGAVETAGTMGNPGSRDRTASELATIAAKAGDAENVKLALRLINNPTKKDETAHEAAGLLAKHGQRRQAIEIARSIGHPTTRDRALAELAQ